MSRGRTPYSSPSRQINPVYIDRPVAQLAQSKSPFHDMADHVKQKNEAVMKVIRHVDTTAETEVSIISFMEVLRICRSVDSVCVMGASHRIIDQ